MEETKIREIVRMLRRMDIGQLRRVYFFVAGVLSPAVGAGWVWEYYRTF